ncbi:MAG: histidine--tRNA ligase [Bacteroidetes bacterium]|nr:histidine--tRNA ligase [Bacteroidota bacterium]HET6244858.1 histidine--tRNA ligase [Bacteroidia bacterium]
MAQKPSIPKGTRDFSPEQMVRRNYIFDTIRTVYQLFGFMPIETPSMENLSTLTGKYGEEGDQLIFKILNSGDFLSKVQIPKETLQSVIENSTAIKEVAADSILPSKVILKDIAEKALRYDLTVPFARYIVQHRNEITFPFKRYQIQPVWRADRPQKGRYREFFQCDADIIGSDSLLNEVELVQIMDEVYARLGIGVTIKVNNRKILTGIAEIIGEPEKIIDITVAIDKLDKIGLEKVNEELLEKGIAQNAIDQLKPLMSLSGTHSQRIDFLKEFLNSSPTGLKGIEELEYIFNRSLEILQDENKQNSVLTSGLPHAVLEFDVTLARGLNYYTGAIFEVKVNDKRSDFKGSICGGGRYDDLTGNFGLPGVSGVGISFGADRTYDVMEEIGLFPDFSGETTKLLFVNFGENEEKFCLSVLRKVRAAGINAEIYPDQAKMKKQMSYADSKKIPFVAIVGSEEIKSNTITLKNMISGEQQKLTVSEIINLLKTNP